MLVGYAGLILDAPAKLSPYLSWLALFYCRFFSHLPRPPTSRAMACTPRMHLIGQLEHRRPCPQAPKSQQAKCSWLANHPHHQMPAPPQDSWLHYVSLTPTSWHLGITKITIRIYRSCFDTSPFASRSLPYTQHRQYHISSFSIQQ